MNRALPALFRHAGVWVLTAGLLSICAPRALAEQAHVDCAPGNPSGSEFTSIQAAIVYLGTLPVVGDWDRVLLRSNCTENVSITRSHVWITPEFDCPWSGCPNTPTRITAANPAAPVITVDGPHDVTLVHVVLSGGVNGLSILSGGWVSAYGVVAEKNVLDASGGLNSGNGFLLDVGSYLSLGEGGAVNNAGYGLILGQGASASLFGSQSWLQNVPLTISGNGHGGLRIDRAQFVVWAGVTVDGNKGWGLLLLGADATFGSCCGSAPTSVRNNLSGGAFVSEGSEASFWGQTAFQNNGPYGVYLDAGSSAVFDPLGTDLVIEGHTEVGVDVTTHGHAEFRGPVVRNNGTAMKPWSAGVRVDGGSQAYFGNDSAGTPAQVTDNSGPGILVDLGSELEVPSAVIEGNSKEAVRIYHHSTAFLGRNAQVQTNGYGALRCDLTSLVVAERLTKSPACLVVERATEPRPPRPDPFSLP